MARIPLNSGVTAINMGSAGADNAETLSTAGPKIIQWAADINTMTSELYDNTVVAHSGAGATTLVSGDMYKTHTNRGGTGIQTWTLPVGASGHWVVVQRIANFAVQADPSGSEGIGDGGAGKYLELTSRGTAVLEWQVDRWEVVGGSALYSYEA